MNIQQQLITARNLIAETENAMAEMVVSAQADLLTACGDWLNEVETIASDAVKEGIDITETRKWYEKEEDAALQIMELAMKFYRSVRAKARIDAMGEVAS